jgi:hypothetical protein
MTTVEVRMPFVLLLLLLLVRWWLKPCMDPVAVESPRVALLLPATVATSGSTEQ